MNKATIPIKKANPPINCGNVKSDGDTATGCPEDVIIMILVMVNTVTKKHPDATVADFKILSVNGLSDLFTNKLAVNVIENPPNNEAIRISWLANVFQYSKGISFIVVVLVKKVAYDSYEDSISII
ncbi:hypothetical protein FUAX_49800 (plasmid) [Fulvitalea axinellae]|uniref:Uncharacterized protein n=2 Tax=Fulvitalea axinellae TaxID=1182444 RepID=A0AAU9D9B7_9BACT|nr:hypothetical protein FUAX_49800 [Fulvitalea axinellae]